MAKTIGKRLRELRLELGISLEELAERCGLTKQGISYYELDKGDPKISVLKVLADGLGCTIFDIIDEPFGREDAVCIHKNKCMFYNKDIKTDESKKV